MSSLSIIYILSTNFESSIRSINDLRFNRQAYKARINNTIIPKWYAYSIFIIFVQDQLRSKYETVGLIYDNVKYMSR